MQVLFLSSQGDSVGLARRVGMEGFSPKMFLGRPGAVRLGQGIVPRALSWRPLLAESEFIFCDSPGWGKYAKLLKGLGRPVLGCDELIDQVSADPEKRWNLLETTGAPTIFRDTANPLALLLAQPDRWGLREVNGKYFSETYKPVSQRDIEYLTSRMFANSGVVLEMLPESPVFQVQAFWNVRRWVLPILLVVWAGAPSQGIPFSYLGKFLHVNKVFKGTLEALTPFLRRTSYRGSVVLECFAEGNQIRLREVYFGLSAPVAAILLNGIKGGIADILYEIAIGGRSEIDVTKDYICAVPTIKAEGPFFRGVAAQDGIPINGLEEKNLRHIYLQSVCLTELGYEWTPGSSTVFIASARGTDVSEAISRVKNTLSRVSVLRTICNTNLEPAVQDLHKLKEFRWL